MVHSFDTYWFIRIVVKKTRQGQGSGTRKWEWDTSGCQGVRQGRKQVDTLLNMCLSSFSFFHTLSGSYKICHFFWHFHISISKPFKDIVFTGCGLSRYKATPSLIQHPLVMGVGTVSSLSPLSVTLQLTFWYLNPCPHGGLSPKPEIWMGNHWVGWWQPF